MNKNWKDIKYEYVGIYYNDWKKRRFYNCFVQARSELTVAFLNEQKEEKKSFNQLHLDSLKTIVDVLDIYASLSVHVFSILFWWKDTSFNNGLPT